MRAIFTDLQIQVFSFVAYQIGEFVQTVGQG